MLKTVAVSVMPWHRTNPVRACRQSASRAAPRLPWVGHHPYPQAVLANVLNPKAASIYLTLAPQFLTAEQVHVGSLLILASLHVLAMTIWLSAWAIVLAKGGRVTRSDKLKCAVNRLGGAILIALGVRTVAAA